jgi:predicted transcriptional regulator
MKTPVPLRQDEVLLLIMEGVNYPKALTRALNLTWAPVMTYLRELRREGYIARLPKPGRYRVTNAGKAQLARVWRNLGELTKEAEALRMRIWRSLGEKPGETVGT